jgi:hypothetical protein
MTYIPGQNWYICDRCDQKVRKANIRKEWSNLMVCEPCLDPRPVEMTPPVVWPEGTAIPDSRPRQPDVFVTTPVRPEDL